MEIGGKPPVTSECKKLKSPGAVQPELLPCFFRSAFISSIHNTFPSARSGSTIQRPLNIRTKGVVSGHAMPVKAYRTAVGTHPAAVADGCPVPQAGGPHHDAVLLAGTRILQCRLLFAKSLQASCCSSSSSSSCTGRHVPASVKGISVGVS